MVKIVGSRCGNRLPMSSLDMTATTFSRGRNGDDTLLGEFGHDPTKARNGNDVLTGGQGDDAIELVAIKTGGTFITAADIII